MQYISRMFIVCSYWVLITTTFQSASPRIFQEESPSFMSGPNLKVRFSDQNYVDLINVDQSLPFTWTNDHSYQIKWSKNGRTISENDIIKLHRNEYKAIKRSDNVTWFGIPFLLQSFEFYVIDYLIHKNDLSHSLGFAYKFNDESLSIVHHWYWNQQISKLQYVIYTNTKPLSIINQWSYTIFYIGGIPEKELHEWNETKCLVDKTKIEWNCPMSKIVIDEEKVYRNHYYTYFNSIHKAIVVPEEVFVFWKDSTIIGEYWDSNDSESDQSDIKCQVIKMNKEKYYQCHKTIVEKLGKIEFVIGGVYYVVNLKALFDCKINNCEMMVKKLEGIEDVIILGMNFWRNYITLYDYEKSEVVFYTSLALKINWNESDEIEGGGNNEGHYNVLVWILLNVIWLASWSAMICWLLYRMKYY